jgi:hypothetical protein
VSTATDSCLVDSKFGPGHDMYMKTKSDLPAEAVWFALKDFSESRPTWWPFISPALYKVHDVGEGQAEVTEGTKMPGMSVWARERYDWDDAAREMRSTVLESNIFKPGGTARIKVTPTDEGCVMEEWYSRERVGLRGKLMNRMAPRMLQKMVGPGRAKTYAALAERRPHETSPG